MEQRRRGEKFSFLAPANIFNHCKLKLETELEGRTVKSLFINESPTRSQKAFPLMKDFNIGRTHDQNCNPAFKSVFKGTNGDTESEM